MENDKFKYSGRIVALEDGPQAGIYLVNDHSVTCSGSRPFISTLSIGSPKIITDIPLEMRANDRLDLYQEHLPRLANAYMPGDAVLADDGRRCHHAIQYYWINEKEWDRAQAIEQDNLPLSVLPSNRGPPASGS